MEEQMKSSKLLDLLKTGNIVIPIYLLRNYKKLGLEIDEFVFLMYLVNLNKGRSPGRKELS